MGRFAGLIIALGFGVAVLSGHGLARAEPSVSSSDQSSGSSSSSGVQRSSDAPSTGDSPDGSTPDRPAKAPNRRSQPDTDIRTPSKRNSAISSSATESESTAVPTADDVAPSPPAEAIGDVSLVSGVSAGEPTTQRKEPPDVPAGAPVAWSMLAFARREFETALTPEPSVDDPAAVQAVENSLTYTPPPTIIDQVTIASLRVVRDVTGFFGIPFTAIVGQLLASEDPPFFLTLGLNARKTEVEVSPGNAWKVWEFEPPNPSGATVVAIHGGGFIVEPNLLHWIDYTQMARETAATVLVPLYPLATTETGSILNVTPGMANYLSHVIDERGAENVSVYADSGGATYAFAAVRELILRGDDVPASMVIISGQADYSTENDGAAIDDPFFNTVTVEYFSSSHAFDGVVDKDPRISPLRMETEVLRALPPTTMYVGTEEILLPGNLLLYQRAVAIGAPISLVVGRGQFHNWPQSGLPVNSAAPLVRRDIYRQLGLLRGFVDAAVEA